MNEQSLTHNHAKQRVLVALLDTFWPSITTTPELSHDTHNYSATDVQKFYATQASAIPGVVDKVWEAINGHATAQQIHTVLWLLATRLGTLLLTGKPTLTLSAFSDLPFEARQRIVQAWAASPLPVFRKLAFGLKALMMSSMMVVLPNPILDILHYSINDPLHPKTPLWKEAVDAEHHILRNLIDLEACSRGGVELYRELEQKLGKKAGYTVDRTNKTIHGTTMEECVIRGAEVVIVGSGAGGSMAAHRLASAGFNVLVIEKGPFVPASQNPNSEGACFGSMYEGGGLLTTASGGMSVLAGSTLGGGTRVNWCASFKTPDHVRREWAEKHGLQAFTSSEYDAALEAVWQRLRVQTGFAHGRACSALAQGLTQLGVHVGEVPRNCVDIEHCSGHCTFGCARGGKQDAVNASLLCDAHDRVKIMVNAPVDRILISSSSSSSSSSGSAGSKGRKKVVRGVSVGGGKIGIEASTVILAAGSLHTPVLLKKSGVVHKGVGENLRLHPCTVIVGVFGNGNTTNGHSSGGGSCGTPIPNRRIGVVTNHFDQSPKTKATPQTQTQMAKIQPYLGESGQCPICFDPVSIAASGTIHCSEGPIMSVFSRQEADWEGSGYGCVLYNPATHPGLYAAAAPWTSGSDYKELILQYQNVVPVLVLCRDRGSGRVGVGGDGQPGLHYTIHAQDKEAMVRGMKLGIRAMVAAGADSVFTLYNGEHQGARYDASHKENDLEAFLRRVEKVGIPDLRMATFSAHQMGTARMGTLPETSVVDENGESWEVGELYCCDASVFPTSLGINPMVTIEAISWMLMGRFIKEHTVGVQARVARELRYDDA